MVCLPNKREDENLNDTPGTVTGWGLISHLPPQMSTVLRSTTLKVLTPYMCMILLPETGLVIDHSLQICAHQPNKQTSPSEGDSGGKDNIFIWESGDMYM